MLEMLALVPDSLDKREGSVIYNALAPAAVELSQAYIAMQIYQEQTYLGTAIRENLDKRAMDFTIPRIESSTAFRIAQTLNTNMEPFNVPIGSRFAVPDSPAEITYRVIEYRLVGECIIECEQAGTVGNAHIGLLLPLFPVNNLGRIEIVGTLTPGQDREDDDTYRQRVIERLRQRAFAGNVVAYKEFVGEISGVGSLKVFRAWQGGGTVLISVVDSDYLPITQDFIDRIKEEVDPSEFTGGGIGTAPIGHSVTVTTPIELAVNVSFNAALSGVTVGQIQIQVEEQIARYLRNVRMEWAGNDITRVFASRVGEAILQIAGVVSISNLILNSTVGDISTNDTIDLQQVPVIGSVSILT
jgi:uncharacterized phage protein gp47/JayE